jgi:hypothetical protein
MIDTSASRFDRHVRLIFTPLLPIGLAWRGAGICKHAFDERQFRDALAQFATGVAVVTSQLDGV